MRGESPPEELYLRSLHEELRRVQAELHSLQGENRELRRLLSGVGPSLAAATLTESRGERIRRDLEAAARIQRSLLPATAPCVAGARFAWAFHPCEELAGDNLNVIPLDEEHVALYVLDVSGHGVSASLLAVTLHRVLSTLADENSLIRRRCAGGRYEPVPPAEVAGVLNREFRFHLEHRQYFTILYGILHLPTRRFRFVSGGHWGPIRVRPSGEARILHAPGFPIGVFEETAYEEHEIELEPGDRLFLYTDGIPEAIGESGETFDYERIEACLAECRQGTLEACLETLVERVASWTGRSRQEDDISVLALELDTGR